MKIVKKFGRDDLATVYIGETSEGKRVEFVQSLQPPLTRDDKWVLIVSTLFGCPVKCEMCDAGTSYAGKLTEDEIYAQLDHMVDDFFPNRVIPSKKFKIQFARSGEPSFNDSVLNVLRGLPGRYKVNEITPSLSSIAPRSSEKFFEELLDIKNELYPSTFQLQFSIHSTDEEERDKIMPVDKWSYREIAVYGERFYKKGGKKVTLNFIYSGKYRIDPIKLREIFSPEVFFIKMTPLNPTFRALEKGMKPGWKNPTKITEELKKLGFEVLFSLGELEENKIGSNCGQFLKAYEANARSILSNPSLMLSSDVAYESLMNPSIPKASPGTVAT